MLGSLCYQLAATSSQLKLMKAAAQSWIASANLFEPFYFNYNEHATGKIIKTPNILSRLLSTEYRRVK